MKTPLDEAADHCLKAVQILRAYIVSEDMAPDDPHLKFCTCMIESLQSKADQLSPPKESWPKNVTGLWPRGRTGE